MKMRLASIAGLLMALSALTAPAESMLALKVGAPLMVGGAAGLRFASPMRPWTPSVQAEAGIGGGKLLVGGDTLGKGFGVGVRAVLLRTWLEPLGVDPDTTYLGADFELGFKHLVGSLGAYVRVEGADNDDLLLGASLGWLF